MNEEDNKGYSLKERLRLEAEAARQDARARELTEKANQEYYENSILPVMLSANEYFRAIVEDLNTIESSTTAFFPIGPTGSKDVAFNQADYRFFTDDPTRPRLVSLACTCEMKIPTTRNASSTMEANEFEKRLREMGVNFYRRRQENLSNADTEKSKFTMEGSITAGFELHARPEKRSVELFTRNLESEPRRSYLLKPELLGESLYESLGKLLLRETPILFKVEVDPRVREEFRRQLEAREKEQKRTVSETDSPNSLVTAKRASQQVMANTKSVIRGSTKNTQRVFERFSSRLLKPKDDDNSG